jgi:PAS domain S-box-containing protein
MQCVVVDITDRKRAEEALIEESARFNIALENLPQGLAMFDEDQRLIVSNARYATMYGLPPEELKSGITLEEILRFRIDHGLYQGDDPEGYMREVLDWAVCGVRSKKNHTMPDGRTIEILHQPMPGGGWLTTHHDISERIQGERALRESEELFSKAFQASPAAFSITNPDDSTYYDVNDTWVNVLGYSREEALSRSSLEMGVWCEPSARERFVEQLKSAGSVRGFEALFRTKGGDILDVLISAEYIEINDEPRLLAVAHDITERKKAEHEIRTSQQRFRDIVETASDWIWECDADLRFTYISDRYTKITGMSVGEVIGKTRFEVGKKACEDNPAHWRRHLDDLTARRAFRDFRYSIKNADGKRLHFTISGTPVFDESGNFEGYRGTGADTTAETIARAELVRHRDHLQELVDSATADLKAKANELKNALEREKELNVQQRQFISMASHEFRTPLAVIDGLVQRMIRRSDKIEPAELIERAGKIRGAVQTITTLMESTLSAARMDSGEIAIDLGECDLEDLLREICARQADAAGDARIKLDLDQLPDAIVGDRVALSQIFTNLLSNAIKYSLNGEIIKISGRTDKKYAEILFEDQGIGIDTDDLPNLFTRFFRARTSTGIPGTGIGLNLVKSLVELHGGSISVTSARGEGSTFTVRLPIDGPSRSPSRKDRAA